MDTLSKPPALQAGDRIAVIAPSGPPDPIRLEKGIELLESSGFSVVRGGSLTQRRGYLAGPDQSRALEFENVMSDPDIKAVFAARGGTGALRLLPLIDFSAFQDPKIFMGYSDATVLQMALFHKLRWPSLYGPMVGVDLLEKTHHEGSSPSPWLHALTSPSIESLSLKGKTFQPGVADGILIGGCLTLIQAMLDTGYLPVGEEMIFFWEDVGEDPYKIDRMLTQLKLSGFLDSMVAMVVGELHRCSPTDDEPSLSIEEIIGDHFAAAGIPVLLDVPFGHGVHKGVVPIGCRARVQGDASSLILKEGLVR